MHGRTRTRRSHHAAAVTASLAIVLAACGGDTEPTAEPVAEPAAATQPPATDGVGTEAPAETTVVTTTGAPATAPPAATGSAVATTAPPAVTPSTTAPLTAPDALRFSAPLVGGGTIDAASLAGTPVLFWFWAPY